MTDGPSPKRPRAVGSLSPRLPAALERGASSGLSELRLDEKVRPSRTVAWLTAEENADIRGRLVGEQDRDAFEGVVVHARNLSTAATWMVQAGHLTSSASAVGSGVATALACPTAPPPPSYPPSPG